MHPLTLAQHVLQALPAAAFVNLTAAVANQWQLGGLALLDPALWVLTPIIIVWLIVLTLRGLRTGAKWTR